MIELLGVGIRRRGGGWLLRRACARLDAGELSLVVSAQPDERRALIDAVTGRRVPDEGRVWVNHVPLMRDTARRVRRLGGVVESQSRLSEHRSVLWNALAPNATLRTLGGLLRLPHRREREAALAALERVGLRGSSHEPVSMLGVMDRVRLLVARALARGPEHLVVRDPDAVLLPGELAELIGLLLSIARSERLGVMASLRDAADIGRLADRLLVLDDGQLRFSGHPDDMERARAGRAGALTT